MGHTFPGATVPFGSVQLSPDTDEQPHNIGGKTKFAAYSDELFTMNLPDS